MVIKLGVRQQQNAGVENRHLCAVECFELFCVTYKPVKLWDVKVEVHEKHDVQAVEKRGIDPGQKALQILINTFKCKSGESGEGKTRGRRQMSGGWVGARSRGTEFKTKVFESGHHCQSGGHCVG